MYIDRYTKETEFSASDISCVVKKVKGYNGIHSHEFYEMEFVLEGEGVYTVDGIEYEIHSGALLFMSPAGFHSVDFTSETTLVNIMFEADMCNSRLLYALFSDKSHIWEYLTGEDFVFVEKLCTELAKTLESDSTSTIFVRALMDCIASKVLELSGGKQSYNVADSIQKAVAFIHAKFTEKLSLEDVAAVSGYSPSYFSERFRSYIGTNFKTYLCGLRFSYAEKLLKYTDMSVTEICFECGFNNYSHFMTAFKERYKQTPIDYRKGCGSTK